MTRDEAIKIFNNHKGEGSFSAGGWIDRFAALGILKLNEPKSAMEKFIRAMESQGYQRESIGMRDAITAIKSAKIKLVDE